MSSLKRELTLFDMTMIAIGSTIGSGIFLTPAGIARELGSPALILLIWALGGLMALSGALTFAELGAMMPRAGGVYVFLTEAYGGLTGFLYGWAYFLVVNTSGIAALSVAFATYFGYFVPVGDAGIKLVAIIGLVVVTAVNVVGVKTGGIFSDIFTLLKLIGIAGLIVVGFGWGRGSTMLSASSSPFQMSNFALAMVGVLWSYGSWQHATFTAGEAKNPARDVPRAMIVGTIVVVLTYVLANLSYMFLLPLPTIASSPRVASDAVSLVLGSTGGSLIALAIFISTFGTAGIYTLTAPRIYYAMANDGLFFKNVARVHPRFHTPMTAILFQSAWAILLILFWGTFENLISYVVFTDWIFFALAASSVFIFRKRTPHIERPYKILGYPFTPLFFIAVAVWFVLNTLVNKPEQSWAGLGFLALGVPVYYYWKNKSKRVEHPSQ